MSNRNLPDNVTDAMIDAHMSDPDEWQADWLTTELERKCKAEKIDLNKLSLADIEDILDAVHNALDDYIAMKAEEAELEADYRYDCMKDEG